MNIVDAATARAMLDEIDVDGGDLQVRDGATVIFTLDLDDPALAAAAGTGSTSGSRTKDFLGEPLTSGAAAASTTDNATELVAYVRNSGGTDIVSLTCTTTADGTGEMLITAPGHAGNTSKPNIVAGGTYELQAGAQLTL